MSDRRTLVLFLSWKVVGEPEWCDRCHHNTRVRVEGTGYTERGFLGSTLKASYCKPCAEGESA